MTSAKELNQISKFLSLILRHKPDTIGIELDSNGWANIEEIIIKTNKFKYDGISPLNLPLIKEVVKNNDKKRFSISEDGEYIRANQGHSINVDLQFQPISPPETLYHGTATRFLTSITEHGLKSQQRQYVHLSTDVETAITVGQRYGNPIVLEVKAQLMYKQGFKFYQAKNNVWLIDNVPSEFISLINM
ncbi:RNA 2'-phosphotransferase [Celerinatantimonas sp. YJH-8]|uniref:RNA 2'-phosphotransferase n=1 Tax=Celerinatantimonas sp. YJH-8 TaxID=3228714 RepID=UPI0038C32870